MRLSAVEGGDGGDERNGRDGRDGRDGGDMMKEYLERFTKRMEVVADVDSIVGRINKNMDVERQFSDGELDNILMSVLVFIMETTLTEEQDCTIEAITEFLSGVLPAYGKSMGLDELDRLSRYLIKDILQNGGATRTYPVMDYTEGMKSVPVRLVADKLGERNQILYELTRQGFDFLFRTKEVDDELGFEIETIRLRMLISKKNYQRATSQSKYILAMLIEKRNELRQFEQQLRHDIFSVSGEQYDLIVENVDNLLREEYETMREIERMLAAAQARLDEESRLYPSTDEKSRKARREIVYISANVQRALAMQRELLIKCNELRKLYLSLLQDSLSFHQIRRFDLEEQVLKPMEELSFSGVSGLIRFRAGLLTPLFLPDIKRSLNLSLLYERQVKLKEREQNEATGEEETLGDDGRLERIRARNEAHVRVVSLLLRFAETRPHFLFGDFWDHIKTDRNISEMTGERLLFLDMLKLYEIRDIDLDQWIAEGVRTLECMGEFDLDYCLARCFERDGARFTVRRMTVDRTGGQISCLLNDKERVTMDDLLFEVSLHEANGDYTE